MRRHPSREPLLRADPTRRAIVLGPRAHELRAYLGPTAWAALEEMMQRSTGDGDQVPSQVSIRSLAFSLALAKDTVARAVRRLRDLGVIAAAQARSASGVFEAGSYRRTGPEGHDVRPEEMTDIAATVRNQQELRDCQTIGVTGLAVHVACWIVGLRRGGLQR